MSVDWEKFDELVKRPEPEPLSKKEMDGIGYSLDDLLTGKRSPSDPVTDDEFVNKTVGFRWWPDPDVVLDADIIE